MDFWVQASSPRYTRAHDPIDTNVSEAIETVFPLQSESALLVWHHSYIALSYKYDISVIIVDLVSLLSSILESETGQRTIQWSSNTFCARWVVQWRADELSIDADWLSVVGASEQTLNATGQVKLSPRQFVAEWKQLLCRVVAALEASGYQSREIEGLDELKQVYEKIQGTGILYG